MKKFFVAFCLIALTTVSFVGCNPPAEGTGDAAATTTSADDAPAGDDAAAATTDEKPAAE